MSFENFDGYNFENEFDPKEELKKYNLWGRIGWNQIFIKSETIDNLIIVSEKIISGYDEKLKVYELLGIVEGTDNNKYDAQIFVYEVLDRPFEEKKYM